MRTAGTRRAGGFTVIELTFSIAVIFLIMGLLLAGLRYAVRAARGSVDTTTVNSLKVSLDEFKNVFGFYPPLVKDQPSATAPPAPLTTTTPPRPIVCTFPADIAFLRGDAITAPDDPDLRFTIYGLAYYVIGALGEDVDGQGGPGLTTPTADGGFTRKGRKFDPFFDTSRNARAVVESELGTPGTVELRDAHNIAFRYYRWLHDAGSPVSGDPINVFLNVPDIVGDPETRLDVRNAEWAIVGAGRDQVFGDEYTFQPQVHPQHLTIDEMASRVGVSQGSMSTQQYEAAVRKKAKEDNVVVIGGSK